MASDGIGTLKDFINMKEKRVLEIVMRNLKYYGMAEIGGIFMDICDKFLCTFSEFSSILMEITNTEMDYYKAKEICYFLRCIVTRGTFQG